MDEIQTHYGPRRRLPSGSLIHIRDIRENITAEQLAIELAKVGVTVPVERIEVRPRGVAVVSVPASTVADLLNHVTQGWIGFAEPLEAQGFRK